MKHEDVTAVVWQDKRVVLLFSTNFYPRTDGSVTRKTGDASTMVSADLQKMVEIYITFCPKCVLWTVSPYMTWQIIPPLQRMETGNWPSDETWCVSFTSCKRTGRKRSLPIGTAFPNLFHSLQKVPGRAKVCALCIEKKKNAPSGRGKQTTYKCKQCDLPLCRVGCFLEYHEQRNVEVQN